MTKPKVSVICITYNQENYIKAALDSFVMQVTSFDFEVIVADDGSTDGTRDIIKKYAEKYPKLIKPILRKTNIGASPNFIDALKRSKGKFIALCEGDDYWTDPKKLQLQVDFLDRNPSYALCFHPVRVFFENGEEKATICPDPSEKDTFTNERLIAGNFIYTNSIVYRRQDYTHIKIGMMPQDWYLHLFHARFGKLGFINRTMSDYRRHSGGVWWESYKNIDKMWLKYGLNHIEVYEELLNLYDEPDYQKAISDGANHILHILQEIDKKYDKKLFQSAIIKFPNCAENFKLSQEAIVEKASPLKFKKIRAFYNKVW